VKDLDLKNKIIKMRSEVIMNNKNEKVMRLITKIEIFFVAIVLTFFLFNMMTSPSAMELIKVGKQAGYEIISNVVV
jgi:hypothetical protein